ncbi:MAG: carbamoyltransferase HypF [Desulfobacteraceae bacterium]|nr:carbamoyltransferase HypF [Desulfobacteraceae bacterium]MBC2753435.1 carbamoyltransferase HypF [Desulfobacteraceae bacterium]
MTETIAAKQIRVKGIVQGVGFRPYVYQLAGRFKLCGHVANTAAGVRIHVEGPQTDIAAFLASIPAEAPPLAQITDVDTMDAPTEGFHRFDIIASRDDSAKSALISPDVAICDDCLQEMLSPRDRRFRYPFINCTNCGPRYTIIDDIPYDRPQTSMASFPMCALCQAEYDDPENRRFHAQPNACPVCGPHVQLLDGSGQASDTKDPIGTAVGLLKQGRIVAIKGLGGFHLAVDAENEPAVARLRQRKHREEKPLAVMAYDGDRIRRFAHLDDEEMAVLASPQRPILLLAKRSDQALAPSVAPHNRYFGVMLPYAPLHYLLLEKAFAALVMTSANLSEEPIAISNHEAVERLAGIADAFLVHNRDIYLRCDDSIVRKTAGVTRFIRRARGYVPTPVFLNHTPPPVLACGAALKNTVCLTKEDRAFISQHIGDLENLATYGAFRDTIAHLQRILAITPQAIACDLHPDYLSTRYTTEQSDLPVIQVQHHHAHIVSAMAENHLDGRVIGLAFDGTGYGPDGTIWGGEVLLAENNRYERAAFLEPLPMPGGTAAIKAPWRMAISYLYQAFGESFRDLDTPFMASVDLKEADILVAMMQQRLNAPLTSSMGRLFDGIAALIGLRSSVAFEGQAAMELEMIAAPEAAAPYDFSWQASDHGLRIPTAPIIQGVVTDIQHGLSNAHISRRFHTTLIHLLTDLCSYLHRQTELDRVVLSGGTFQNAILLEELSRSLAKNGFAVYAHRLVPPNDGGISLGQAVAAGAMLADGA